MTDRDEGVATRLRDVVFSYDREASLPDPNETDSDATDSDASASTGRDAAVLRGVDLDVPTGSFTVMEDEMPDFYVSTETYWNGGPDALPEGTNGFVGTCAPEREFFPSMDPTFYVQIYETETGKLVGAPTEEGTSTPTPVQEGPTSLENIADTKVGSVTVTFPDTDQFEPLELEWMSGIGDDHAENAHDGVSGEQNGLREDDDRGGKGHDRGPSAQLPE